MSAHDQGYKGYFAKTVRQYLPQRVVDAILPPNNNAHQPLGSAVPSQFLDIGIEGGGPVDGRADSDWTLARALQAMEFEISNEATQQREANGDFDEKEYRASACKRQLLTVSTAIILVQVCFICNNMCTCIFDTMYTHFMFF